MCIETMPQINYAVSRHSLPLKVDAADWKAKIPSPPERFKTADAVKTQENALDYLKPQLMGFPDPAGGQVCCLLLWRASPSWPEHRMVLAKQGRL
ncbi:unnamed protein product [Effrenium voratum]|nr:unnamed protein product [Effrenium voratum]